MQWKIRRTGKLFPHAAVRVRVKSRVKIRVRIRARVEVRARVSVSVSYIMTIWRWEEFSRCDKFPTTPVRHWLLFVSIYSCIFNVLAPLGV